MSEPRCQCHNHLGGLKNRYSDRDTALKQAIWHARKGRGGTFTIVTCPKDPGILHIVSSREAKK